MCLFGQSQPKPKETPPPVKPADQKDIGSKAHSQALALFGGVPNLRVDRSVSDGGVAADGSGLNMMQDGTTPPAA